MSEILTELGAFTEGIRLARLYIKWRPEPVALVGDGYAEVLDNHMKLTGQRGRIGKSRFMLPVSPSNVWCVGLNYRAHAAETNEKVPDEPCVFMKPRTCLIPHEGEIKAPLWAGRVDYEGELAVVIGSTCKNVDAEHALDYVLGYSCFNDVTARDLQRKDGQWTRAKSFDTFGALGPAVLVGRSISPDTVLTTRLNGKTVQSSPLSDMIFSVPEIVSHISRFTTLHPGDVIATGTPCGIGPVKPGDVVEVEVEGIGVLRNSVVEG
ncbi:MAG: fumarylacetoacetate hydrolase family protein [Synergistaceae bacterium]|nr:fumarylacetoacetate hydrolase family protein [Synergistaceae bacterium]